MAFKAVQKVTSDVSLWFSFEWTITNYSVWSKIEADPMISPEVSHKGHTYRPRMFGKERNGKQDIELSYYAGFGHLAAKFIVVMSIIDSKGERHLVTESFWSMIPMMPRYLQKSFAASELGKLIASKGNLTVKVEIYSANPQTKMEAVTPPTIAKWSKSGIIGDITVVSGDQKEFRCHKDLLSQRCEFFRLAFNTQMKESGESRIELANHEGDFVAVLISFIYTDTVGDISGIADRLYAAAHEYQLDRLMRLCEEHLALLSTNTIVKTLRIAKLCKIETLIASCLAFIKRRNDDLPREGILLPN